MKNKTFLKKTIVTILMTLSLITLMLSTVGVVLYLDNNLFEYSDERIVQQYVEELALGDGYRIQDEMMNYAYIDQQAIKEIKNNHKNTNLIFIMENKDEEVFSINGEEKPLYGLQTSGEYGPIQYKVGVTQALTHNDKYTKAIKYINKGLEFKPYVIPTGIISLITFIGSIGYLIKTRNRETLNELDKLPIEVLLGLHILLLVIIAELFYAADIIIVMYVLLAGMSLIKTLDRQLYHKVLFKYSLLYKTFKAIKKSSQNIPNLMKGILLGGGVFLAELILISLFEHELEFAMLFIFILNVVLTFGYIKHINDIDVIEEQTENIVKGDLDSRIETDSFLSVLTPTKENLNNISQATKSAVEKEMQSERLKTELITNVSHDIKTPITSILNYVDLLKETEDEHKKDEYLDVLTRQSNRLKYLVEDLIEASKLSTGSVSITKEKVDLKVLFDQLMGELESEFASKNLEVVYDVKKENLITEADGQMLSRLFDNVLQNTIQYSLENTRVYITLDQSITQNVISIKNISKDALNIDEEELMERFMRGDSSRNTEGSGLGLSIAKSIVELHEGRFNIEIDGDLFKVTICLSRGSNDD